MKLNLLSRFTVKIPNDIIIFYFDRQGIIIVRGYYCSKLLYLNLKIYINKLNSLLQITEFFFKGKKNNKVKFLQGIFLTKIKQLLLEVSVILNKKLNIFGIGYKVFLFKTNYYSLLKFKLGYCHSVYYKINLVVYCLKAVSIFLLANSINFINQNAGVIKKFKKLNIYKNSGIFYEKEKLNESKKL